IAGRTPPRIRLPHNLVLVVAAIAEAWSRVSGKEPWVNLTSVRLARKKMYFSTEKAQLELGYRPRPIREAFRDAIDWYRQHGYIDGA
ncbi:MAG TPA: hypothetical protein P5573_00435, partial [Syntrophales bacterium]|nr:hypothetical protein [Syntrophales bacterium]